MKEVGAQREIGEENEQEKSTKESDRATEIRPNQPSQSDSTGQSDERGRRDRTEQSDMRGRRDET